MNPSTSETEARWLVTGRVQGVGFRWFVLQAARELGIRGDVRNLGDGAVEIRARGAARDVAALLDVVRRGPSHSRVDVVERLGIDGAPAFDGFDIRR